MNSITSTLNCKNHELFPGVFLVCVRVCVPKLSLILNGVADQLSISSRVVKSKSLLKGNILIVAIHTCNTKFAIRKYNTIYIYIGQ